MERVYRTACVVPVPHENRLAVQYITRSIYTIANCVSVCHDALAQRSGIRS